MKTLMLRLVLLAVLCTPVPGFSNSSIDRFGTGVTQGEPSLPWVRNVRQNKGVIVFVHGVLGDARNSWSNGTHYWPTMLLGDSAFDGQNIYVYEYPTPIAGKTFSIDELADNMRLVLSTDGVLTHESITFVSHSMGGLVTRDFILKYRQVVVPKIRFLYFFATPTTGTPYALLGKLVSDNPQFGQLYPMSAGTDDFLAIVQSSWLAANLGLKSYCAYETFPTYRFFHIVERQSATNLCTERLDPIDANHIDIVKPASTTSTSYRALKNAFQETAPAVRSNRRESRVGLTNNAGPEKPKKRPHGSPESQVSEQEPELGIRVVDSKRSPIKGSHILLVAEDGTHVEAFTDREGTAHLAIPNSQFITVFCAHPGFSAFYRQLNVHNVGVIELSSKPDGGAVIIPEGTGYIPGLAGRLNPILDNQGRTYIYADNVAINGGAAQPVDFIMNRPFRVRDSHGKKFELEVVAIIGRSSLIEYSIVGTDDVLLGDKEQQSQSASGPSQNNNPPGPTESSALTESVTTLRIPGPSSGSRVVRFETNGDTNQKISVQLQPQKILFEPPNTVVERKDLPVELQIGGHKITIVAFTDEGFILDSHGVAKVAMGAYVLEGIPSGKIPNAPTMVTPPNDLHDQLVGGRLAQGWTLHKHGEAWTLYCITAADQLTPVVRGAIEQSDFAIGPELSTKAKTLWAEIRRSVPAPKLVETEYGLVTGQEVVEHVTHQFDPAHIGTVQWTYEILRNGTGITPEPQVLKDIDVGKLSQTSRDTIDELNTLAIRTVNRRYIDALLKLSK